LEDGNFELAIVELASKDFEKICSNFCFEFAKAGIFAAEILKLFCISLFFCISKNSTSLSYIKINHKKIKPFFNIKV
jgi:hypothetical protein